MPGNITGMSSPGITIEKVGRGNFEPFLGLVRQLAGYERLVPPDDAAAARLKADCFSDPPRYEAYIASLRGRPVGYVTFYLTYSTFLALPTLFLEDIFVEDGYRGSGVGKALFDFCRSEAKRRGCGRVEWLVLTWNEPALRFYEKCGGKRLDWYFYRLEHDRME